MAHISLTDTTVNSNWSLVGNFSFGNFKKTMRPNVSDMKTGASSLTHHIRNKIQCYVFDIWIYANEFVNDEIHNWTNDTSDVKWTLIRQYVEFDGRCNF